MDINNDLAAMIKETLDHCALKPQLAPQAIASIKTLITNCCEHGGASNAVIWGLLNDQEKTAFKDWLSKSQEPVPLYSFPSGVKRIKDISQTPSMRSQSCITELMIGKRWQRAVTIATKDELETALGSLGNGSDRYIAISAFMDRAYPEKRSKTPIRKKVQ